MAQKKPGLLKRIVVLALFCLLILSFAAWGIQDIFLNLGNNQTVAKVGDIEITQAEFASDFSRETSALSQQLGRALDAQEAQQLGLDNRVVSRLVARAISQVQSDEMGLTVSREQQQKEIQKIDAFKNEAGLFDAARFQATLYQAGLSEAAFLADLSSDIERQQLNNAITGAIPVPQKMAERLYSYQTEKRVVDYIEIPYSRFSQIADPTDAELASYYENEKQNHLAPEYKSVSYIFLDPSKTAQNVVLTDDQVQEEFLAQKDSLSLPDRRKLVQMLINDEAKANEAYEKVNNGADFDTIATEVTGSAGVDLGIMERSDLLPELQDAVFGLENAGVVAPIKSPLGWHIVSVQEISPTREAQFEEVEEQIKKDAALRIATDEIISIANQLDDEIASGATLEEAASKLGQEILSYEAIDAEGLDRNGLPQFGLAEDARFREIIAQTESGSDSLLTELENGGYFLLKVNSVTPPSPRPLEEVKTQLVSSWLENKRSEEAKTIADKLAEEARNGTPLQAVTDEAAELIKFGVEMNRFSASIGEALAPALVRDIYKAEKGDVLTGQADNGYLVVSLTKIEQPDLSIVTEEIESTKGAIENSYKNDVYTQYISALEKDFGVEINQTSINQAINPYGHSN
ncbi:SurA N-terminal domain-containing protein [Kiloniella sp. EL199]|uniref:SurA N-terminal domain-containing protein n=1 Tax=Kiloniella sp. EL199 TaxID=2107581 RepID=UPI000EA00B09|nr:SurA N-terminal domain-containing protein [Kiloniella sp. EL199]